MVSDTPKRIDPSSVFFLRRITLFGAIIAASMAGALVLAFMHGGLFADSEAILALVWGRFSVFELYIGFALVAAWILSRESHPGRALVWIAFLMIFGHVISGLYILSAAHRSHGDIRRFWLGTLGKPCA